MEWLVAFGMIFIAITVMVFACINFKLPTKDPEVEYYHKKLQSLLQEAGLGGE